MFYEKVEMEETKMKKLVFAASLAMSTAMVFSMSAMADDVWKIGSIGPTTGSSLDSNYATMKAYPEFGSIYMREDGMPYTTGDLFKNTQQGKALQLIADYGRDGFYNGELLDAMITAANKYGGTFVVKVFKKFWAKNLPP